MKKLGTIIDNLKNGKELPTRHENPYFSQALALDQYLLTTREVTEQQTPFFENKNSELIIEIGCYMGKNILEFALQNKDLNFMGLDITYKRAVKAAQKLKRHDVDNAKIALCDGMHFLQECIKDQTLQGVCVFFPDPWPKDRHEKNRLLKQDFIDMLKLKLAPKGFFWLKTDALSYFENTDKLCLESGFQVEGISQPQKLKGGPYETAFQKIFKEKDVPFYEKVYINI